MANSALTGPIPEFLDKISKSWSLTPLYPKIWAVTFQPCTLLTNGKSLGENIKTILDVYNDRNFYQFTNFLTHNTNLYKDLLSTPSGNSNIHVSVGNSKHFLLATRLTIPGEQLTVNSGNNIGQDIGGSINGRIVNNLHTDVSEKRIKISVLDTYRGFRTYIAKPWIIALGHRGLKVLNDPSLPDLRCDITAVCFAKSGPTSLKNDKPTVYKVLKFHNCFPISCSGKTYQYDPSISNDEYISEIEFGFDWVSYEVNLTADPVDNGNRPAEIKPVEPTKPTVPFVKPTITITDDIGPISVEKGK